MSENYIDKNYIDDYKYAIKIINDNLKIFEKFKEDNFIDTFDIFITNYSKLNNTIDDKIIIFKILSNIYFNLNLFYNISKSFFEHDAIGLDTYLNTIIPLESLKNKLKPYYDYINYKFNDKFNDMVGGKFILKKTNETVNIVYKKKSYKRTVFLNKNKKKFVKINNNILDLSKLKKI